jgi:hypothetical protein
MLMVCAASACAAAGGARALETPALAAALDSPVAELEALEARLRDTAISPADRADVAKKADAMRARLIEQMPGDDRTPSWLVDRAVFTLAGLSESDADLAVLVGLPTPEQRVRAAQAAHTALTLLERAQTLAQAAVAKLEGDVVSRPDTAAAADQHIARLVELEQSQRIPLYAALGKTLLAACAGADAERTAAAAGAVRALDSLRVRTPALEAAKDTVAALAVLNASGGMTERAATAIKGKLQAVMSNPAAEPATKARARLGLLAVGEGAPTAGAAWTLRLLEAEARVRAQCGGSGGSAPRRISRLAGPAMELVNLAAEPVLEKDLGGLTEAQVRDGRRALIYLKIAPLVDTTPAPGAMPAELLLARAVTMLRESPRSFAKAEPLLRHVADRVDATADIRGDALWRRRMTRSNPPTSPRPRCTGSCSSCPSRRERSTRARRSRRDSRQTMRTSPRPRGELRASRAFARSISTACDCSHRSRASRDTRRSWCAPNSSREPDESRPTL